MNGLSDDCLKEDSPGKNEPNHKSNLVCCNDPCFCLAFSI